VGAASSRDNFHLIDRILPRAPNGYRPNTRRMSLVDSHSRNLRKGRYSAPGIYYFLTTSVAGRRPIFTAPEPAYIVLETINWLNSANRFIVDAAVVMPDHLHLVGQLGGCSRLEAAPTGVTAPTAQVAPTLARVMHSLKSYSATKLAAPVWQPGYHDHALRDDEDYGARVRYTLENPVRAGMAERPEAYPYVILPEWWSSS
jgi:REP element-mobilizing transposase RayT